ncbi:MAG: bifunctional [glutamate--ammonia ligase]-adenylyl-L-tyrosine phosphorylase/[glutamate--ammonia-ligase] adenylyltransferase [Erythrobacter sp.]|uniref:bifunctional [glutamate--ammonia ligase]-adenylyl-L-tyrosine phosphorylase/[glutamate--ammonia-ligase] adenylyltransferase n=1 Tax=Qipengyuania citrea TaxID=225971 RepID=UPI00209D2018|nr:bifunctional [glutamate--ammonia ligase]-adenylyl-L-tyrosine phosphorylase/[glutamate--ammonia-ligase] adenylyltransferase [Qipengyuania citrea]MCP2018201.1 glutamate-ammonia-ligase adenylyltransferase [Qipengyuania citrea]MDE0901865.1 bifunctional [glutamate--ammonia ligase]-adenylyl-L-tyrosine phosphorylase/[glutamate--ammonia-ligase] adenylyltransferase [Erythrobacter sp.]
MAADWTSALNRARDHAPFLARALERRPDLARMLAEGAGEEALLAAKQVTEADVATALRRERLGLALVLAVSDLAGAFDLEKVMRELSTFADRALHAALAAAIRKRVPDAEPAGMIGLALGKHGAGELNYSSDIDPILLYEPEQLPRRERDEPGEAAQRYARETVRLLSDVTSEGYVFRVDLRLRPAAEVSPLAISLDSAITHYESSALAWERAAFIRARACAGDIGAGEAFLDHIRPFVWRRSLDFGAIDEVRRLTHRIRDEQRGPRVPEPGYNLKLGRGGIREIEFFAQTHQLIHGGRDPSLRVRGTRAALDALAVTGRISSADAQALGQSYDGLRTIEHRLQMVGDKQTHTLPAGEALDTAARLHGLDGGAALIALVEDLARPVAERFDALLDEDRISVPKSAPHVVADTGSAPDIPVELVERMSQWTGGRYPALRSTAALSAFEAIRPDLLSSIADSPDPAAAAVRWESLIARLPSAINLFRLLEARPGLFALIADCLTLAPPLAEDLSQRPELLDALIDRTALDLPGSVAELAAHMGRRERGDDYEMQLDRLRVVTGETRFALAVQLVEAAHDPLAIAAGLARTAEAALQVAVAAAEEEFAAKHGRIAGSELVVVGLGRLGGGVLTHASDLDIVYLFTGTHEGESDGERPLGATLYFNRLAQRVTAALSVPTAQGALYEVDTRLRPQGNQGPLAASVESFARYQREDAWTWEHMALTRARVLVGSDAARAEVGELVTSILCRERDPDSLRKDVLTMRGEMAAHKSAKGPLDAKLLRGGLVDIEFLVHYLQLRDRAALGPDLGPVIGKLVAAGKLPPALAGAHRLMTRLLVGTRLLAPDLARPNPAAAALLARQSGCGDYADLTHCLRAARHDVAAAWQDVFGETLEMDE